MREMMNMDGNSEYLIDRIDTEYSYKRERYTDPHIIPLPLQQESFRFCLVRRKGKEAFEKDWQDTANYPYGDSGLLNHILTGGNYGVIGGFGGLVVIDIDRESFIDIVLEALPATFTVRTKKGVHLYYKITDGIIRSRGLKYIETGDSIGDIKAGHTEKAKSRGYVVGPGSVHPSGFKYKVLQLRSVKKLTADEIQNLLLNVGITIGDTNTKKRKKSSNVKKSNDRTSYHVTKGINEDPEYLQYLPLWYRTYHRKQDGSILRSGEGRLIHLRICATLKKHGGDSWKEYAHQLTHWMFRAEYDFEKTEYQLKKIDARYYYRKKDFFFSADKDPDLKYLTTKEREMIRKVLADSWEKID